MEEHKQYVAALYVRPPALDAKLRAFRDGRARVLVIEGPSGAGKTSAMVNLVDQLVSEDKIAFFFLARDARSGICEAVAKELGWSLSGISANVPAAIRAMVDALSQKNVFIVVDNLDELAPADAIDVLESLILHAPPQVRLIVTCTKRALASLLHADGVATALHDDLLSHGNSFRFEMQEIDDATFSAILVAYERYFDCTRPSNPALLADARRDPLVLRLAFEAGAAGAPGGHASLAFYEAYFERQLIGDVEVASTARRILRATAACLVDVDAEHIDEMALRIRLGLSPSERLPDVLFRKNILSRLDDGTGDRIGFTYSRMRDFVYTVWERRWGKMNPAAFAQEMTAIASLRGATRLKAEYYRFAADEHRRVLDEPAYGRAVSFVNEYLRLWMNHFAALVPFGARTAEEIGLIGYLDLAGPHPRIEPYGLRRRSPGDAQVVLLPLDSHGVDIEEAFAGGAHRLGYSVTADGSGLRATRPSSRWTRSAATSRRRSTTAHSTRAEASGCLGSVSLGFMAIHRFSSRSC